MLTDSAQVGEWGAPTLDVWVVRKDFAEQHPEIVKAFAKSAIDAQQPYIANPETWLETAGQHRQAGAPGRRAGSRCPRAGEGEHLPDRR